MKQNRYLLLFFVGFFTAVFSAPAQTSPAQPAAAKPAQSQPLYNSTNQAKQPYSGTWPKPIYPSTERKQKQFTVEYVYNYAESDYTPPIRLTTIARAKASYATPEDALVAFVSAVQTLDYDWWLSTWDAKSQVQLRADAVKEKKDAAYFRQRWQTNVQGKAITLFRRRETGPYVILDYWMGAAPPQDPQAFVPIVFKLTEGKWQATEELQSDDFYVASAIAQNSFAFPVDPIPVPPYSDKAYPQQKVQQYFLTQAGSKDSYTQIAR